MYRVLGKIHVTLTPKVKVKCQIMNFLVNTYPPKPSNVATSNFVAE